MNKLFHGTIARTAIQCKHPSGETGDFLFISDDHRNKENVISPAFDSLVELHEWLTSRQWESVGRAYRYTGPTLGMTEATR